MVSRPGFWMMLRFVRPFRWLVMAAVSTTILAVLFPPRLSLFSSSLGPATYGNRAALTPPPPIPTGPGGAAPSFGPSSPKPMTPAVPVAPPVQGAGAPSLGTSSPAAPTAAPSPVADSAPPAGPRAADVKPALVPLSGARREAAPPQPGSQPLTAPARPALTLKPSE